jgi:hypothetical protein
VHAVIYPAARLSPCTAAAQVKVCIIDTGMNYLHPDLAGNAWMNPVEMAGPGANAANGYKNGIDDDGDGACSRSGLLQPHSADRTCRPVATCMQGRVCHVLPCLDMLVAF